MMDMNNIQLLRASREGDVKAFGEIVKRHQNSVSAVTYSITGSIDQSEDLAQEAFIVAWQKLKTLKKPAALSGWLCGIARNLALNWLRDNKKEKTVSLEALPEQAIQTAADMEEEVLRQQRYETVWAALRDLPETYREPLVLFYRNSQSVREVADALDLTEDCVKQRLSRGRKLLRQEVARIVEEILEITLPGPAFTAGVVTALSALGISQTASATVAGGTVAATTGKTLSLAGFIQLFGILAGPILGFTGGLFGMWSSIYRTPTLRTRRFVLKYATITFAIVWVFLGCLGISVMYLSINKTLGSIFIGLSWGLYIPILVGLIIYGNVRWRQIAEEDAGRRPMPKTPLKQSNLSLSTIGRTAWITQSISIIASIGFGLMLSKGLILIIGSTVIAYLVSAILITLFHYAVYRLFQRGLDISRDQAAYDANPSPVPNMLELMLNENPASHQSASRKGRWGNDLLAFAGAYFGGSTPIWIEYYNHDQFYGVGTVLVFGILSMCILSRWFGIRRKRNWALGLGLILAGCFLAINAEIVGLSFIPNPTPWVIHLTAILYFALFTLAGILCMMSLWLFKPNSVTKVDHDRS